MDTLRRPSKDISGSDNLRSNFCCRDPCHLSTAVKLRQDARLVVAVSSIACGMSLKRNMDEKFDGRKVGWVP